MGTRAATEADLPQIVEIYNASVPTRQSTADTSPVSVDSRREWFRRHTADHPLLVHEIDGEIVAWISFQPFHSRPAYRRTSELSLYVRSGSRRQGIGKALLEEALSRAARLGIRTAVAYVFAHNAPSIGLLESFGFEEWGRLPNVAEMGGIEYTLVIYGKPL